MFLKVLDLRTSPQLNNLTTPGSTTILNLPTYLPSLGQIFHDGVFRTLGSTANPPHRDDLSPFGIATPFHQHFISLRNEQHAAAPSKGRAIVRHRATTRTSSSSGGVRPIDGCTREHERSCQSRKEEEAGRDVEDGKGYQEEWTW